MKYAASQELARAKGEIKRKGFLETVMMRSFKNQFHDWAMQWKNFFGYAQYQRALRKRDGKDD